MAGRNALLFVHVALLVLAGLGIFALVLGSLVRGYMGVCIVVPWGLLCVGLAAALSARVPGARTPGVAAAVAIVAPLVAIALEAGDVLLDMSGGDHNFIVVMAWQVAPVAWLIGWVAGGPGPVPGLVLGACGASALGLAASLPFPEAQTVPRAAVLAARPLVLIAVVAACLFWGYALDRMKPRADVAEAVEEAPLP